MEEQIMNKKTSPVSMYHLVTDEIFIDCAIHIFEKIDFCKNHYIYIGDHHSLEFIKGREKLTILPSYGEFISLVNREADFIVLHSKCIKTKHLLPVNPDIKIIWLSWGYDLYTNKSFLSFSKKPLTLKLYKPLTSVLHHLDLFYLLKDIWHFKEEFIMYPKFLRRVNYMSTVVPEEYERIRKNKKCTHIQQVSFFYIQEQKEYDRSDGMNILVGNSSCPEGNHLDILLKLKAAINENQKAVMPMSYGDKKYAKLIETLAKWLLPGKVIVLRHFLPFGDYSSLLNQCSFAIFGNVRQQAMGNISLMLAKGCKVFLYEDSIGYRAFKERGYTIYSIDRELTKENLSTPLTDEDTEKNRSIFYSLGFEKRMDQIKESFKEIIEKRNI